MFTSYEREYLKSQRLVRIATVDHNGQPDVVPVGFEFEDGIFYIGGSDVDKTRKVRNVRAGNRQVALVIDDLVSVNPYRARGVRVYGTAEVVERTGWLGHGTYLRIEPQVSWSWGLDDDTASPGKRRKTIHRHASEKA